MKRLAVKGKRIDKTVVHGEITLKIKGIDHGMFLHEEIGKGEATVLGKKVGVRLISPLGSGMMVLEVKLSEGGWVSYIPEDRDGFMQGCLKLHEEYLKSKEDGK